MYLLVFVDFLICTKVTISPIRNTLVALSYSRKDFDIAMFDFATKTKINQTLRTCMAPLIVPLRDGKHRFYFCGELMCLRKEGLGTCSKPDKRSAFELIKHEDRFLISSGNLCMHVNNGNIYLRECNAELEEQLFFIDRVFIPQGDNVDVAPSKRQEGFGNRLLLADRALREMSKSKSFEYIRELFDNEMKYEVSFSNKENRI